MRKLLALFLLCSTPALAETWVATVSVSGTSANTAILPNTNYTIRCTVPVRYRFGNGSSTVVSTSTGATYGFYYDTAMRDFFDLPRSRGNDTFLALVSDPTASGTCDVFTRDV